MDRLYSTSRGVYVAADKEKPKRLDSRDWEIMPKSRSNGVPAYQKIQATIMKRIDSGQLKPGDAVDSERELAKIHQVSLMTARHALTALEREGMVQRRRGAGTHEPN